MNFNNWIERNGVNVTLKNVSVVADDSTVYGTLSETYSSTTIKAAFTPPKQDDLLVKQGIMNTGDMYCFVKTTQAIAEGSRINWNGSDWEVISISKMPFQGGTAYLKVGISRRQDTV